MLHLDDDDDDDVMDGVAHEREREKRWEWRPVSQEQWSKWNDE